MLALVIAVFISLASASVIHSAVVVIRPPVPIPVFGVPSIIDVPIDIDQGGASDFNFNKRSTFQLTIEPLTGGQMIVTTDGGRVTPLRAGDLIADSLPLETTVWAGRSSISACAAFPDGVQCLGDFFGVDGYIGIQFPIEGETHFGWVRFDHFAFAPGGSIVEWAYNDTPSESILAAQIPEPSSTALLVVVGLVTVVGRRRRNNESRTRRNRATDGAALFPER